MFITKYTGSNPLIRGTEGKAFFDVEHNSWLYMPADGEQQWFRVKAESLLTTRNSRWFAEWFKKQYLSKGKHRSNVNLRSNTFLCNAAGGSTIKGNFIRQVRDHGRIKRIVQALGEDPHDDNAMANLVNRGLITEYQRQVLKWAIVCGNCNAFPVGQTFHGGIEFRCTVEGCK